MRNVAAAATSYVQESSWIFFSNILLAFQPQSWMHPTTTTQPSAVDNIMIVSIIQQINILRFPAGFVSFSTICVLGLICVLGVISALADLQWFATLIRIIAFRKKQFRPWQVFELTTRAVQSDWTLWTTTGSCGLLIVYIHVRLPVNQKSMVRVSALFVSFFRLFYTNWLSRQGV